MLNSKIRFQANIIIIFFSITLNVTHQSYLLEMAFPFVDWFLIFAEILRKAK